MWSLGCVLYEMLTLKPPFMADDMQSLFRKVTKGSFQRIPKNFTYDLAYVIKWLLQVRPDNRPTCDQLIALPIFMRRLEKFFPD
jgi:NIMA (never in mitosis gene a)-related kinase 1/4/5